MSVDEKHPQYTRFVRRWAEMRDHIAGTERIKERGEKYLPKPAAMRDPQDPKGERSAYNAYKTRAQYPEIVGPSIRSMSGVIHREKAGYEYPDALEYLRERATLDSATLEQLHRRISRELLGVGRCGLMVDTAEQGGDPYIALYQTEAIINWHETDQGVDMVVLDESDWEMNPETFAWTYVHWHRVLLLEDGQYVVRLYREGVQMTEDITPQRRGGGRLESLPFVFVDTNDLTPEPDEVPLYGLAQIAAGIYRVDADYRQALFLIAQPQRWVSGVKTENVPSAWGSNIVFVMEDPQAQAGILEFTGQGVGAQRQAMIDGFEQAAQFGARLYDRTSGQESGEARKIRHGQETATLATIAQTGAAGLEQALGWCAEFMGANSDEVQVEVDTDFMDRTLGAQEMAAIIQAAGQGVISDQTAYEQMQAGGRADTERTWEEERELIEQGGLGMLGREGGGNGEVS